MSANEATNRKLSPLARIVATASYGIEPLVMGLGPVSAIERLVSSVLIFRIVYCNIVLLFIDGCVFWS